MSPNRYEIAGIKEQSEVLAAVLHHLGPTLDLPAGVQVLTGFGSYAAVLKVSDGIAIAISTDGVGSKTLIASALGRYETIGFDCVAMNVNDILCVGARPIAMVDYLGVHSLHAHPAGEILRGLGAAAKEAGIAVPGGELAQLPEVIGTDGGEAGDAMTFDLVGTCIGTVHPDRVVLGGEVRVGDAIVGIASTGIHSNGLTLARTVLLKEAGYGLDDHIGRLGRSLGDELLQPTEIYVRAVTALWDDEIQVRGLAHITSDGFANLCRLDAPVGYTIGDLPEPPAIFGLIQEAGGIPDEEMYRVFNMGVGFVVIVPEMEAGRALEVLVDAGYSAGRIGSVTGEAGVVRLEEPGLVGTMNGGKSVFRRRDRA